MAATSKLSPQERILRKRNAARLRQQRCRARKKQALLEKLKRERQQSVEARSSTSQMGRVVPTIDVGPHYRDGTHDYRDEPSYRPPYVYGPPNGPPPPHHPPFGWKEYRDEVNYYRRDTRPPPGYDTRAAYETHPQAPPREPPHAYPGYEQHPWSHPAYYHQPPPPPPYHSPRHQPYGAPPAAQSSPQYVEKYRQVDYGKPWKEEYKPPPPAPAPQYHHPPAPAPPPPPPMKKQPSTIENKEEAAIDAILSLKKSSTSAPKTPLEPTKATNNASQGSLDKQAPTEQLNKQEPDERGPKAAAAPEQNRQPPGFYLSMRFN